MRLADEALKTLVAPKAGKEENNMAGLLDLPIEVVKMILEQLASDPKTSVMDYYNWIKVMGDSGAAVSALLREKVYLVNLCESTSDFVQTIRGYNSSIDPKDVIPSHVNHVVIAADEGTFDEKTPLDLPQPYGSMKIYLAYHYTGSQINLKRIHAKYVDKFPFGCLRPNHIIAIGQDSSQLRIERDDGNMFDSYFYPEAKPLFQNVTFFNVRHLFIDKTCLSDFAQMRQGNLKWSKKGEHGVIFERLGKYYRENETLYPVKKEWVTKQYRANGFVETRDIEVYDRDGCEEPSNELQLLMKKSYLTAYLSMSMSCPQLEAVTFARDEKDEKDTNLNMVNLHRFLQSSSDYTLQEYLTLHSLRNWNLPSIRIFSGHNFLWHEETTSSAKKYADAISLIPTIRSRVQKESPDGLLHINAQLVPDGVLHTKINNWVPLDVDFVSDVRKSNSPLICLRQPCLKSLKLGLLVSKPEGSLTVEGLYLPQLGKLDISFNTELVHRSVRNPMFNITFSEWNDLRDCRLFDCQLNQEYEGHINMLVSNLKNALPRLESKKCFKGLERNESVAFSSKGFVLDGLEKIELPITN
ncbi:Bop2p LALA0_S04e09318g [Lachancea lanzarotensis]|uniref:LALA0S04e09318g1_1 n=1 Tax=Lachancea lanzarotensis TaxID=1245769 RepID=A0A0C7MQJ2_9SACH|nr:uncharacterized protein LALA0_S04e09318g [Lachancea lanzarotensis]CEP62165.1 LALA0S04e09318g1_1 [Lachancea lanzarotensis]